MQVNKRKFNVELPNRVSIEEINKILKEKELIKELPKKKKKKKFFMF